MYKSEGESSAMKFWRLLVKVIGNLMLIIFVLALVVSIFSWEIAGGLALGLGGFFIIPIGIPLLFIGMIGHAIAEFIHKKRLQKRSTP